MEEENMALKDDHARLTNDLGQEKLRKGQLQTELAEAKLQNGHLQIELAKANKDRMNLPATNADQPTSSESTHLEMTPQTNDLPYRPATHRQVGRLSIRMGSRGMRPDQASKLQLEQQAAVTIAVILASHINVDGAMKDECLRTWMGKARDRRWYSVADVVKGRLLKSITTNEVCWLEPSTCSRASIST